MSARIISAIALLAVSLAACGKSEPSADDLINDASDMAAGIEQASSELTYELRTAAAAEGDMPCGLPSLPDATDAQPMNIEGKTFNTASEPEQVAAFYDAAAEARGGSATTGGPPGMSEVQLSLSDGDACVVIAQTQMSGDTNVQITKQ